MAFVPLFCQSHYSPAGVASPVDLIRRARAVGYNTLGLCDEASIGGIHDFDVAARAQGIRPIFGCRLPMHGIALRGLRFPVDFLIETEQGYRNLVRLLTRHYNAGQADRRPLTAEDLVDRTHGLIPVIPYDGELGNLIRSRDRDRTELFIRKAAEVLGPNIIFGSGLPVDEDLWIHSMLLRLARFVQIPVIAAPLIQYPEPGDDAAAHFLRHPRHPPSRSYQPPQDLKLLPALWPEDEMLVRWQGEMEEIPHFAGDLARRCTWRPDRIRRAYPALDFERGFDPNSYLFDQVIRGATQRYGEITESIKQRINREFEDVRNNNLAPCLLLHQQIVKALEERGISRGVGRGRIVASVLAYCLGITRIDPFKYNLVARRLIVDEETSPSINVEIPRNGVQALLDYLREAHGEGHLAEIGRVQEIRREQMINELADWAGMTREERRLVQREKARLRSAGAAQRLGEMAQSHRSRRWRDAAFLGDLAARLSPRPRHWVGTADRYVLSGEPLEWTVPLVASHQGRPVTGIEEPAIDRLGLARLILVPHGLLDILDQATHSARAQDPSLDLMDIPLDDRSTFELLGRGDTSGVPPLESISLRCLLRKTNPRNLLQLLRVRTESHGRREGERSPELSDELPDVLLSYQCAFLKVHFPLAFFGAAIGAVVESRNNPAAIIRAARRAGFEVQPPDINVSDWGTTIHAGNIRLGLATVRGFGRKAWENLSNVRSGGNFNSLEDFCERVDTRLIPLRLVRRLIAAGAMDGLNPNRAAMDAQIQLMLQRDRNQGEDEELKQATLFELDEWEEGEDPLPEPETLKGNGVPRWNPWEQMQRESEALGFYLSIDPVKRFRIALDHLRPLHMEQVGPRLLGRTIRMAGLVCGSETQSPLIEKEGEVLLDLEGLPVFLAPGLAEVSGSALEPSAEVVVIGKLLRDKGFTYLDAEGIWRLEDLEDQATKVARVRLDLAGENRSTLNLLLEATKHYPGNSELELLNYPQGRGWGWRRLSRRKIFFCSPLYQAFCRILSPEAVELIGADDQPLIVKASMHDQSDEEETHESNGESAIQMQPPVEASAEETPPAS